MPPRTGPRRRRRVKAAPPLLPRHFTIVRADETSDPVFVLSIELAEGCLVLRNQAGAIEQIVARGQWREIRPAYPVHPADLLPEVINPAVNSGTDREQATLVGEADPAIPPAREEIDSRFVPGSPEEAQRILMELHRRIAPDYQDPPEVPPPVAPPKATP